MNAYTMLWTAIVLFAIAAAGGLILAGVRLLAGRNPPAALALLHGLLAGAGLTLLLYAEFTAGLPTLAVWGLVLLVLAACGGLVMNLVYAWNRKLIPRVLVYGHGLIAVAGFIVLIVGALGGPARP